MGLILEIGGLHYTSGQYGLAADNVETFEVGKTKNNAFGHSPEASFNHSFLPSRFTVTRLRR
jgi:hypothetical protein